MYQAQPLIYEKLGGCYTSSQCVTSYSQYYSQKVDAEYVIFKDDKTNFRIHLTRRQCNYGFLYNEAYQEDSKTCITVTIILGLICTILAIFFPFLAPLCFIISIICTNVYETKYRPIYGYRDYCPKNIYIQSYNDIVEYDNAGTFKYSYLLSNTRTSPTYQISVTPFVKPDGQYSISSEDYGNMIRVSLI